MLTKKKALGLLAGMIGGMLLVVAMITWVFDPFYQYHKPFWGREEALYDRDNQVVGTIRNNDYDTVLLGSSVAENFDSSYIDDMYGGQTLKIIRASGSTADLLYYLNQAHDRQQLQTVLWCMDLFALTASPQVTLTGGDTPLYLHTPSILDDGTYLFNKDILCEKIPQMLAFEYTHTNTGGNAYNWADGKEFSAAKAMQAYDKPAVLGEPAYGADFVAVSATEETSLPECFPEELSNLEQNISSIQQEISSHPDTSYVILFPPYSMMWWDCGYVNGLTDLYLEEVQEILPKLLCFDNVSVYYFQSDEDIICNLDNYMDMIHYSPEINQTMLEAVREDLYRVEPDHWQETFEEMKRTLDDIVSRKIYQYYPQNEGQ